MGFDFNLLFLKVESVLLGKGLTLLLQRVGWAGGLFFAGIFTLLDVESVGATLVNMMAPSGASGGSLMAPPGASDASSSGAGVNQPTLLPAQLPQPPAQVPQWQPQDEGSELMTAVAPFLNENQRNSPFEGVGGASAPARAQEPQPLRVIQQWSMERAMHR